MKLFKIVGAIMASIMVSCSNVRNDTSEVFLFPARQGEKWGYINQKGEVVIDFLFDEALPFSDGLACVRKDHDNSRKWGFIDVTGKTITGFQYDGASSFSDGLALVTIGVGRGAKKGFADKKGECVIEPRFFHALSFSEGLALVGLMDEKGNVKYGFIDHKGDVIIDCQYRDARSFSEGLAAVSIDADLWGFIDSKGSMIIQPQFFYTNAFSEGMAAVMKDGRVGFVDKQGRLVFNVANYDTEDFIYLKQDWRFQIQSYWSFRDGVACVRIPHGNTNSTRYFITEYICPTGKHIGDYIPQCQGTYIDGLGFSEGLASVKGCLAGPMGNKNTKYGYIDAQYNTVIDYRYDEASSFHNGLAWVIIAGKMAYIDQEGTVVWQEQ